MRPCLRVDYCPELMPLILCALASVDFTSFGAVAPGFLSVAAELVCRLPWLSGTCVNPADRDRRAAAANGVLSNASRGRPYRP